MSVDSTMLTEAIERFRAGKLQSAEALTRQILMQDPDQPDALHLLGVIAGTMGDHNAAYQLIRRAVERRPDSAEFYKNLGFACRSIKMASDAIDCFYRALELNPNYFEASLNLGDTLRELGRLDEAVTAYRRTLELQPDSIIAWNNLGKTLRLLGKLDEALACCQKVVGSTPDFPEGYNNLGNVLADRGQLDQAVAAYRQAIRLAPEFFGAISNLGNVLKTQGQFDEAIQCYQQAMKLNPGFADSYNNLGTVLVEQGQFQAAIDCYRRTLELDPNFVEANNNLGTAWRDLGNLTAAAESYQRAIEIKPNYSAARMNLGMVHLANGDFLAGWSEYEYRIPEMKLPQFNLPKWDGSSLFGRRILVYCEQGLGDTIQFIRYIPLVKALGGYVIAICQPQLMELMQWCPGIDELIPLPSTLDQVFPAADVYLHLMSFPKVFGTVLETIPNKVPYLHADKSLVEAWKQKLHQSSDRKVGIIWQGNRQHKRDRFRSVKLAELKVLRQVPGIRLFSLQKGDGADQIRALSGEMEIVNYTEEFEQSNGPFLDLAALIKNLDLVIAVDTSIAHLAGALGVPVWVLLDDASDWRWMKGRTDCPWYPTMKLFRQTKMGEWSDVIHRIASELNS